MQWLDNYGDNVYDGYAFKQWLSQNSDIAVYISALYLAFVFKGPDLVQYVFKGKQNVALIKKMWMVWNLALSVFSLYGTLRVTPLLLRRLKNEGVHNTICIFHPEEFYTTRVGFAMGLFCISKLPEFGDTFFLILSGKRELPFLQWFHHVTTLLFTWFAYQAGSSVFITAAAMNYTVHTIMYFYFALAEAGYKDLVKPFAPYITLMQISQMVGGLFFAGHVTYYGYMNQAECPGTSFAVGRTQLIVYCFNFYLFTKMFLQAYVFKKSGRRPGAHDKPHAK